MNNAKERIDPWAGDVNEIESFLHVQRYEYAMREVSGMILDVGCGFGYGSRMLYGIHNSVVACDVSDYALSYAKRNYKGPMYVMTDAQALPFKDEKFDSVVALEVIEHVDNGARLLREIYRVLKMEGTLVLSTPNVTHFRNRLHSLLFKKDLRLLAKRPKNPYHKYEYSSREITRLLQSAGFTIEKNWGQFLTLPLILRFLPYHLCVNMGRSLPDLSFYIVFKARKKRK